MICLENGVKIHYCINDFETIRKRNPFINYLVKKETSSLISDKDYKLFQDNPEMFIESKGCNNSLFLLNSKHNGSISRCENSYGYHCITSENYSAIFKDNVQLFKESSAITSWNFAKDYFKPHNSLLVVDPYLFTYQGLNSFYDFLETVIPKELKTVYHLSLIAYENPNNNGINIFKAKEELKSFMISVGLTNPKLELHLFDYCKKEERNLFTYPSPLDFHDRYLISNNACVFSGRGLDYIKKQKMSYEGTWIVFKPFTRISLEEESVFFAKVVEEKLMGFKKWIKQSKNSISTNPLVTCYA